MESVTPDVPITNKTPSDPCSPYATTHRRFSGLLREQLQAYMTERRPGGGCVHTARSERSPGEGET